MEESLILYYVDWFTPPIDSQNFSNNMIMLSENTYHTLIQSINLNCLLFLFMFSCFSSIVICTHRDKPKYTLLPTSENDTKQNINNDTNKLDNI